MDSAKVNLLAVIAVLTMLGSAMVYVTNKDSQALKREIDIRVNSIIKDGDELAETITEIKALLAVDDLREQVDLYEKGELNMGLQSVRNDFNHLDAELHIRHRLYDGNFKDLTERVGKLETCLATPKSR